MSEKKASVADVLSDDGLNRAFSSADSLFHGWLRQKIDPDIKHNSLQSGFFRTIDYSDMTRGVESEIKKRNGDSNSIIGSIRRGESTMILSPVPSGNTSPEDVIPVLVTFDVPNDQLSGLLKRQTCWSRKKGIVIPVPVERIRSQVADSVCELVRDSFTQYSALKTDEDKRNHSFAVLENARDVSASIKGVIVCDMHACVEIENGPETVKALASITSLTTPSLLRYGSSLPKETAHHDNQKQVIRKPGQTRKVTRWRYARAVVSPGHPLPLISKIEESAKMNSEGKIEDEKALLFELIHYLRKFRHMDVLSIIRQAMTEMDPSNLIFGELFTLISQSTSSTSSSSRGAATLKATGTPPPENEEEEEDEGFEYEDDEDMTNSSDDALEKEEADEDLFERQMMISLQQNGMSSTKAPFRTLSLCETEDVSSRSLASDVLFLKGCGGPSISACIQEYPAVIWCNDVANISLNAANSSLHSALAKTRLGTVDISYINTVRSIRNLTEVMKKSLPAIIVDCHTLQDAVKTIVEHNINNRSIAATETMMKSDEDDMKRKLMGNNGCFKVHQLFNGKSKSKNATKSKKTHALNHVFQNVQIEQMFTDHQINDNMRLVANVNVSVELAKMLLLDGLRRMLPGIKDSKNLFHNPRFIG